MSGYLYINTINIPVECIKGAYSHMRQAGFRGVEGVALFCGEENKNVFNVKEVIIPKQTALRLEEGLYYMLLKVMNFTV